MLTKKTISISGLHCVSCKTLIESEVSTLPGLKSISVDYQNGQAEIEYEKDVLNLSRIIAEIEKLNYQVQTDAPDKQINTKAKQTNYYFLAGFALFVLLGYFLINYFHGFELLGNLNEGRVAYPLIFVIGLLAGFHCIGMCGGLVIAYSAKNLSDGKNSCSPVPHFQYNLGRIISYTVIGGLLGGLGSFFGINPVFTGTILIVAGVFMVLMGLSFLTNYPLFKKIKLNTPTAIARFLYKNKQNKNPKGPLWIGLLNGFMPCGPLQAMQLYALANGSVVNGAASLFVYALGTSLLMLAFGLTLSRINPRNIQKLIKISGAFVIILGLMMANRGLANFNGNAKLSPDNSAGNNATTTEGFQEIRMDLTYLGYQPNTLYIKKGVPVRWIINVKEMSGCTNAIMIESLKIKKNLKLGENIIEFTPPDNVKEIKFSCWMRMVWGKFIISDTAAKPAVEADTDSSLSEDATCNPVCSSEGCGCEE